MKPAWDELAGKVDSSKVVVADVDCTAEGKPLCDRFGVQGFPTIKYFNPPDEEGEDYEGGRDLDSLLTFSKTLGPGCSPDARENCSTEQLASLDEVLKMSDEDRAAELAGLNEKLKTMEEEHDKLLQSLQGQYEASNKALEAAKEENKPRIKLLKMAGTPDAKSKDEL